MKLPPAFRALVTETPSSTTLSLFFLIPPYSDIHAVYFNHLFSTNMATNKHAVVFGASGITGWAIVNELLTDHPDAQQFIKVTALTNRPLSVDVARWPASSKLTVASGVDILKGSQGKMETALSDAVPDVETVTHVFFNCTSGPPIVDRLDHD
jgi:hypothetical protein